MSSFYEGNLYCGLNFMEIMFDFHFIFLFKQLLHNSLVKYRLISRYLYCRMRVIFLTYILKKQNNFIQLLKNRNFIFYDLAYLVRVFSNY